MQEKFGDSINVHIHTLDSKEAQGYTFKSSTNVLFAAEWVPLDVATDSAKMESYISNKL
jgi:hypothetical protein